MGCASLLPGTEAGVRGEQSWPPVWVHGDRMELCLHSGSSRSLSAGPALCLRCSRAGCVLPVPAAPWGSAVPGTADTLRALHRHFQTTTSPRTKLYLSTFLMLQLELSSPVCDLWMPLAAGNCHAANERGRMTSSTGRNALWSLCFIPAHAFHQQQQQQPSRSWVWAKVHNFYISQHRLPGASTFLLRSLL